MSDDLLARARATIEHRARGGRTGQLSDPDFELVVELVNEIERLERELQLWRESV